jgi:uncharacterized surface protein with fasciclin (FAS1) repeats
MKQNAWIGCLALAAALASGPAHATGPGKADKTIVEIALAVNAAEGEFDYLLGAVGCLTEEDGSNPVVALLSGSDAHTLFAPNDDAFIALQSALGITTPSPEATCALGKDTVFDVLAYHVATGRRYSSSIFKKPYASSWPRVVKMLNGKTLKANQDLTLTDVAGQRVPVVPPLVNVNATNGVVHVVGGVLLPFVP